MTDSAPRLTLFGTFGCHLCEAAEEALYRTSTAAWRNVDIADDESLLALYGTRIPVLRDECSGCELNWPFTSADILGLMAEAPAL